jgi:hypothetical protein
MVSSGYSAASPSNTAAAAAPFRCLAKKASSSSQVIRHIRCGSILVASSAGLTIAASVTGKERHIHKTHVSRAADLCGVARLRALLHRTPAAECERLFRLEPFNRWRGAALDRILSRYCELTVLGQHLQRRTVKPDPAHFTPECTIEVHRRPAPPVLAAPLQRSIAPEGVSKPPNRPRSSRPAKRPA